MAKNTALLHCRNLAIADDYMDQFFNQGKREDLIFQELSLRYFLQPATIRKIVLKQSKQQSN